MAGSEMLFTLLPAEPGMVLTGVVYFNEVYRAFKGDEFKIQGCWVKPSL